jgi:hypothetical protein
MSEERRNKHMDVVEDIVAIHMRTQETVDQIMCTLPIHLCLLEQANEDARDLLQAHPQVFANTSLPEEVLLQSTILHGVVADKARERIISCYTHLITFPDAPQPVPHRTRVQDLSNWRWERYIQECLWKYDPILVDRYYQNIQEVCNPEKYYKANGVWIRRDFLIWAMREVTHTAEQEHRSICNPFPI